MQHKFLLRYIKQKMEKAEILSQTNEQFFKLFLPNEPWEKYRSNMSNWLSSKEDGMIRKRIFIVAINTKLNLEETIWTSTSQKQKEDITKGIQYFKSHYLTQDINFPLMQKESISKKQENFLNASSTLNIEKLIVKIENHQNFFNKNVENQKFLLALFEIMYQKAEYLFIYTYLFPHLLDSYDNSIKAKKADIYASLPTPKYKEAFEILNSIKEDNHTKTIDLKTSAISNIKREQLSRNNLTKKNLKNLLTHLIKCYSKFYNPKEENSYYTGINLAYIIALKENIFLDEKSKEETLTIKKMYQDTKKSIHTAKESFSKEEVYYASITELEFRLLLNHTITSQELEYLLETLQPHQTLIYHTQRQMKNFFIDIIEKFGEKKSQNVLEFKKVLTIFNDYTL